MRAREGETHNHYYYHYHYTSIVSVPDTLTSRSQSVVGLHHQIITVSAVSKTRRRSGNSTTIMLTSARVYCLSVCTSGRLLAVADKTTGGWMTMMTATVCAGSRSAQKVPVAVQWCIGHLAGVCGSPSEDT